MNLNDITCKSLKPKDKPYRKSDGGGLYIEVMPNGSKYWRMNYRFMGKQKRLAFGVYPRVTLKEAREKRDEARKLLDNDQDPSELKKLEKIKRAEEYANNFKAIAHAWHQSRSHTWQPKHGSTIMTRIETYLFPVIGSRPISAIIPAELLHAIRPIEEAGKHEMAHRMLQTTGQIFRYAVAIGKAERDITTDLKGALKPVQSKHYKRLKEHELPTFFNALNQYDSKYNGNPLTKLAFQLLITTFTRSGEIRFASWDEINWEKKQWRIPAARMKMKSPHIVPLSKQAIILLRSIEALTEGFYGNHLFPSQQSPKKVMSENTFLRAIEVMGYKGKTTAHGFRAVASTILNENGYNKDWIERQLAHAERDQVRGSYNHADYLSQRATMMQWWSDYLEEKGMRYG